MSDHQPADSRMIFARVRSVSVHPDELRHVLENVLGRSLGKMVVTLDGGTWMVRLPEDGNPIYAITRPWPGEFAVQRVLEIS